MERPDQKVWNVKLTPFYSYVQNFIDVDDLGASMMGGNILQFANHDAQLAGFDLSGRALILPDAPIGDVSVSGVAGYNYGRRIDGNYLYHMMPLNGKIALEDAIFLGGGRLNTAFEVRAVAGKTDVETLRLEPSTPGFAVMNLRASYEYQNLRFDLGVENLADKLYYEPLGGIDLGDFMERRRLTASRSRRKAATLWRRDGQVLRRVQGLGRPASKSRRAPGSQLVAREALQRPRPHTLVGSSKRFPTRVDIPLHSNRRAYSCSSGRYGIANPATCARRTRFSASTSAAAITAVTVVRRLLTKPPMTSRRPVRRSNATIGTGRTMLSTTWLITSACVEFTP